MVGEMIEVWLDGEGVDLQAVQIVLVIKAKAERVYDRAKVGM